MIIIYFLIPLSVVVAGFFLFAFVWAVRTGQFEDTATPSMRLLTEETRITTPRNGKSANEKTNT